MLFAIDPIDDDAPISVSNLRMRSLRCGSEVLVKNCAVGEIVHFTCSKCNFKFSISDRHEFIKRLLIMAIVNEERAIQAPLL
jgi:transposase-like protein